jgi:hypothetical protein
MKKILGIDGFKYLTDERLFEIYKTLEWNSRIFDIVLVFCQTKEDYNAFKKYNSEKIKVFDLNCDRISMQKLYTMVNENSDENDFKFFANSDTVFGEEFLNVSIDDDVFMLLTNRGMINEDGKYIKSEDDALMFFNNHLILDKNKFDGNDSVSRRMHHAMCGWGWKTPKPMSNKFTCFLGNPGGENCFLREIRATGFLPKSGALIYHTYHNHRTDERTERFLTRIDNGLGDGELKINNGEIIL